MKFLFFSDVHWCASMSIVSARGKRYSQRLQQLVASLNWVIDTAAKQDIKHVICAGDFFDKSTCTDEQLTALQDVKWHQDTMYYFLVGNHESSVNGLRFNTTKVLEAANRKIISQPEFIQVDSTHLHFVPYISQMDRQPMANYLRGPRSKSGVDILISHNDIAGINYAGFVSNIGFSIQDIEANCDLCLNGHLHNTEKVSAKVLNVGSFMAHNFTNDSHKYSYGVWVLDSDQRTLDFVENPYGLSFYKIQVFSKQHFDRVSKLKNLAVVSIKCTADLLDQLRAFVSSLPNIIESRFLTVAPQAFSTTTGLQETQAVQALTMDHFARFRQACVQKFGNTQVLLYELAQISK